MSTGLFPDTADVFCDLLAGFAPAGHIGLATPDNLDEFLPFIRLALVGGTDDLVTDRTTVDIDCFTDGGNAAANHAGEEIRQFLTSGPHVINGVVIDRVRTVVRPRLLQWPTTGVFRSGATYRVSARRA